MTTSQAARVSIEEGVVIGTTGTRDLKADVYTPPPGTSNGIGLLLIHGGGWMQGDRSQLRGYGVLLGRKGFTSVSCEYRLSDEAIWPAQIHDVKAALRWMRAEADRLGIDGDRIAVSGNSAGGHLALVVAGTPNRSEFEGEGGNSGVSTDVAAAISFYPPVRLNEYGPPEALTMHGRLFGPAASKETVAGASPNTHISPSFPPTMLVHGGKDELVPVNESNVMYRGLVEAGVDTELHVFAGQPHGFDASPALGRQCAEIMALFLERYVAPSES